MRGSCSPLHPQLPASFLQEDVPRLPRRPHRATARKGAQPVCVVRPRPSPGRKTAASPRQSVPQMSALQPSSAPAQFFCFQPPRCEVGLPVYTFTGSLRIPHKHAALEQFSKILIQKQLKPSKNTKLRQDSPINCLFKDPFVIF